MGGRGVYSYSGGMGKKDSSTLSAFAVASLNKGIAGGTTTEAAIDRFREQMMDKKVEYSAYIDDQGFVHSLGSTGKEGSTKIAPLSTIAKEKGVSTVIHNHPHGTSDGRIWGGPFSEDDLDYIASAHRMTGGRVNRIVATSNEGTYSAVVRKTVSKKQVENAAALADARVKEKEFQSEKSMWRAVNAAYTEEFGKIGIDITFEPQKKKRDKLVTQKIGTY